LLEQNDPATPLFALNFATCSGIPLRLATLFTSHHRQRGVKRFGMRRRCNSIRRVFCEICGISALNQCMIVERFIFFFTLNAGYSLNRDSLNTGK
jgi:hypothetical protein